MNWIDFLLLAIILLFSIIGMKRGFVYTVFKVISFFVAIFIAIKLYPVVTDLLMKTSLYTNLKLAIYDNLIAKNSSTGQGMEAIMIVIQELPLPQFLKNMLITGGKTSFTLGFTKAIEMLSGELASFLISIISLIFLFVVVWFSLMLLRFLLQGIAKLPVFKQLDKIGGFALGAIEGFLILYIIMTLLPLFNTVPQFAMIFEAIDNSLIAKYIFENNFIMNWMFPDSTNSASLLL